MRKDIIFISLLMMAVTFTVPISGAMGKRTLPLKSSGGGEAPKTPDEALNLLANNFIENFVMCAQQAGTFEGLQMTYTVNVKNGKLSAGTTSCQKDGKELSAPKKPDVPKIK